MNHTQQTANAKIIAELFPPSPEISEAAPLKLSQQQLQTNCKPCSTLRWRQSRTSLARPVASSRKLKAFHRLAARLKKRFPRLPICLSLDCLFACGPVFARCHLYNWRFVIVLKEDDLPSVYNEFLGLAKLQDEGQLKERILKPVQVSVFHFNCPCPLRLLSGSRVFNCYA